jgi:uncharacterized damage-inducible protein DinB
VVFVTETAKDVLHRYLRTARDALLWKLDALSPYDLRRPLVPAGTNLLGLVKHLAAIESGYFGEVFGRPMADAPAWMDDEDEPNIDMYATADESVAEILGLYRRACDHADATIDALPLDALGAVPWWSPERREVTLQQILVHMVAETNRHAGHADLVRELIDGAAGWRPGADNLPDVDADWWPRYVEKLERIAREATD